jgi:hypothetical protein
MKFYISVFSKIFRENPKLNLYPTRIACTLHEDEDSRRFRLPDFMTFGT